MNRFFFFFGCVIVDIFTINVTIEKNCEVRLKETKLDHEHAETYQLKIRLDTVAGVVNPSKSTTMVSTRHFSVAVLTRPGVHRVKSPPVRVPSNVKHVQ